MVTITPINSVFVRVDSDDEGIVRELSDYFQFDVPGAHFMRRNIGNHWSGKIKLYNLRTHHIYRGLVPRIIEFCQARDYDVTNTCPPFMGRSTLLDAYLDAIASELPFAPADDQRAALTYAMDHERALILSPTGSGKSFSIYLLQKFLRQKTLIIVPTLSLVSQMVSDFKAYGYANPVAQIYSGRSKDNGERITVSTWQSIYEMDAGWFNQFGCIIVDEVHTAKSKSIRGLMEQCTKVPYRFGFTGTLDNTECHRLVLEGLFGQAMRVATTAELIKQDRLTPIKVKLCVLHYPEAACKLLRRVSYQDEVQFLIQDAVRNEYIAQLATQTKGNTLVLFQRVAAHGLNLYRRIKELGEPLGKTVHYIAGSVEADEREAIRQAVSKGDNHIVVASYGTTQLGTNIPNLKVLVLAHPAKSEIRVLQSIGRVLRKAEGKTHATIIDIVDDLRFGKAVNHCFRHGEARTQYYSAEKFPVTMSEVSLESFAQKVHIPAQDALGTISALEGDVDIEEPDDAL